MVRGKVEGSGEIGLGIGAERQFGESGDAVGKALGGDPAPPPSDQQDVAHLEVPDLGHHARDLLQQAERGLGVDIALVVEQPGRRDRGVDDDRAHARCP